MLVGLDGVLIAMDDEGGACIDVTLLPLAAFDTDAEGVGCTDILLVDILGW